MLPPFSKVDISNTSLFSGTNVTKSCDCYCLYLQVDSVRGVIEIATGANNPPKTFTFDNVFGPDSKQTDVYNEVSPEF